MEKGDLQDPIFSKPSQVEGGCVGPGEVRWALLYVYSGSAISIRYGRR